MNYFKLEVFAMHGEEVYSNVFNKDEEQVAYDTLATKLKEVPCCHGHLILFHTMNNFSVLVKFDTFTGINN